MPTIEVTERESAAIQRMRMTPQQRRAETENRRQEALARMTPGQRAEAERIAAMPADERHAYLLLKQQDRIAGELQSPAMQPVVRKVLAAMQASGESVGTVVPGDAKE